MNIEKYYTDGNLDQVKSWAEADSVEISILYDASTETAALRKLERAKNRFLKAHPEAYVGGYQDREKMTDGHLAATYIICKS